MARTTRTFIALPLPAPIRARLERLQRLVAPTLEGARWVEPDKFHVTLAFLGDVDDRDLNALCKAVTAAVTPLPAFDLTLRGFGAFPDPGTPRVLWVGLAGDLDALATLRASVVAASLAAGYRPDDDRFHPHVTIGRLRIGRGDTPVDAHPLEAHYRAWAAGVMTAESVVTYASTRTPEGLAYVPLGIAPLARRDRP